MSSLITRATIFARPVISLLEAIPHSFIALVARLSVGGVFWMSGETKISGFHLADGTVDLFRDEYRLPLLDPTLAAIAAAISEHLFSALLIMGLASRLSALALLGMTLVIEIFVYPDAWPTHGTWAACFLIIIAKGPGVISLDHFFFDRRNSSQ
jgi:putative oxidoreductase